MISPVIAPALAQALEVVTVAPDGLKATVGETTIEAPNAGVLTQKLSATLYQVIHTGREPVMSSRPRTLRDRALDQRLADAMPHRSTRTRALVHPSAADGSFVAELNGLRVLLSEADQDTPLPQERPALATLTLPAARPALSPGFFLTDGSHGTGRSDQLLLRVYIHLTAPDPAPALWAAVLGHLEDQRLPYRAKISSNRDLYPRQDALVVYLGPQAWHAALGVAQAVQGMPGLGPTTSPLLHPVAPGVGVAWEPDDPRPGRRGLSFGEHRTGVLAECLVHHALRNDGRSSEDVVAEGFLNASIDPLSPARNLGSPAVPVLGFV
ncbi:T3SS effector HopA1 family protein [Kitasatospora sp. NPDC018058]|uniref:T3SS effector HopA1 family protein n=1 Tax=Kitasatospora sp. NPDC018058 TaxID=3364025 RepID=UPI0037C09E3D